MCMYLGETICQTTHIRKSKSGVEHSYTRKQTVVNLKCDNCGTLFTRARGSMDPKRLSNNYFHVCEKCNAKRFAQKRSVERGNTWSLSASSDKPVGRL